MTYAIINGRLLPAEQAAVSIQDRGFRFGDGVFETIALHNGVPYQYDWHMRRLQHGLEALHIGFDTASLQPLCRQLIHKNAARQGSLRIQVTRGPGSRGYLPNPPNGVPEPSLVIETLPAAPAPSQSVTLWLSNWRKISHRALPSGVKLCQGVNSTLARMEAQANGCFEALMLNEKGQPCEASSANLFWLRDKKLYTPSLACGPLEGSTRAALIRLCDAAEAEPTLEELMEASAVMLTNSSWGVVAISALLPANYRWHDGAQAQQLHKCLLDDRDADARRNAPAWLIQ